MSMGKSMLPMIIMIGSLRWEVCLASHLFFSRVFKYLVKTLGEKNVMGILPGISFVHSNLEKFHVLKDRAKVTKYHESKRTV